MDQIIVRGGHTLNGEIQISGAKNAGLPLMAACLLTSEPLTLTNLPDLADIASMAGVLESFGVDVYRNGGDGPHSTCRMHVPTITETTAPYDLVRKMRASVLVLGPLLARAGHARVSLPGGCAIGTRPVDLHLKAMAALGAEITLEEGYIEARTPKGGLVGGHIVFPFVTVGGTENALMAATLATGETVISNAAREPEITDLANCLIAMGANIDGVGTGTLKVQGVASLHGAQYAVVPDRIETGSYAVAAAITGGTLKLKGTRLELIESLADILKECGVDIIEGDDGDSLTVSRVNGRIRGVDIMTEPYPGFPTDMQAQLMALMATANGASMITESIFENRFMHVPELCRMGANINVHGSSAIVRGVDKLSPAQVMATDLRASVSLVLAALAAEGESVISRVYHLDRGYECLPEKLSACGAQIERVSGR
ncbi:MAG: UDP-N-acetylglucosamine 1-carboxyvinyltransferase [Rhodospirillales bacterium]|jgi:UDP-N-acetylglucosamine 1-carboxyvinyltransferase|nr:UDP-N-acetylglucosamine 1-carboxyvinyltransferase [Rhodospirillales bacterium]